MVFWCDKATKLVEGVEGLIGILVLQSGSAIQSKQASQTRVDEPVRTLPQPARACELENLGRARQEMSDLQNYAAKPSFPSLFCWLTVVLCCATWVGVVNNRTRAPSVESQVSPNGFKALDGARVERVLEMVCIATTIPDDTSALTRVVFVWALPLGDWWRRILPR